MNSKIFLLSFIVLLGCSNQKSKERIYIYPNDPKISKSNGDPIDSLAQYFPSHLIFLDTSVNTRDSLELAWIPNELYYTKEPILSNYYLGHEIYRFTWIRAFHPPVFITLHRNNKEIWLESFTFDVQPNIFPATFEIIPYSRKYSRLLKDGVTERRKDSIEYMNWQVEHKPEFDSINERGNHPKRIQKPKKQLSITEWNNFVLLLKHCNYWKMNPSQSWKEKGLDGSTWIIEAHQKNNYWFVNRWSPRNNYQDCGKYLIELSGLKERIY